MPAAGRVVKLEAPVSGSSITPDETVSSYLIALVTYAGKGTLAAQRGGVRAPPSRSFRYMVFPDITVLSAIVTSRSCDCCPSISWGPSMTGPTDPKNEATPRTVPCDVVDLVSHLLYPICGDCKKSTRGGSMTDSSLCFFLPH